jgi:hypothetical protein
MDRIIHADRWGEIIDRPDADLLELRWFDTTASMTKEQFQGWLTEFADRAVETHRSRVLVDATAFQIARSNMDGEWRDANVIPRYNQAAVSKFAFHMPAGMPMIGAAPAPEGPALFPTAYFATRQNALDWLHN